MNKKQIFELIERNCASIEESSKNGIIAHRLEVDDFMDDLFDLYTSSLPLKDKYNTGFEEYIEENYTKQGDKFISKSDKTIRDLDEVLMDWHHEY